MKRTMSKKSKAKAEGDLRQGDRLSPKTWTYSNAPPPPRWTSLPEMTDEELVILAGSEAKTENSDEV